MATNELEGHNLIDLEQPLDFGLVKEFWDTRGVTGVGSKASGHMNLTRFGYKDGKEVVCQFGPSLKQYQKTNIRGKGSYGYFHPYKYIHAQKISQQAKVAEIPSPDITEAGYSPELTRSWCIAKKASGENLDGHWLSLTGKDKIEILKQFGSYLGKLHSIPTIGTCLDPLSWYENWFNQIAHNLQVLGIYPKDKLEAIKQTVLSELSASWLPPKLTLTHGDPLQKNIFIDPEEAKVTDIIDWETAGIGNPWTDVVLAAWWMSGEYGGDNDQYKAVIDGYNEGLLDHELSLDIEKAKKMNPYIDILWYLNILWVRPLMGDNTQTVRRKGMVEKILAGMLNSNE